MRFLLGPFLGVTSGLVVLGCGNDPASNTNGSTDTGPANSIGGSNGSSGGSTDSTTTSAGNVTTGAGAASSSTGQSTVASSMGGAASTTDAGPSSTGDTTNSASNAAGGATSTDGAGGTGGSVSQGTPHVFVGSTNGMLRAFVMNSADGSLTPAGSQSTGGYLDFIKVGPDNRTLFTTDNGSVAAYDYDAAADTFTLIDSSATGGGGTFVNVDPTGSYVFVAHYNEGAMTFFNFDSASGFGTSQNFSPGQNAHQVRIDAAGTHVYVPCLGSNHVAQFNLDPGAGTLSDAGTVPASGGPRHMIFHPSAPVAYVLSELDSVIHVFDVDAGTGALSERQAGLVYTREDMQGNWSSDIQITPDGQFVYAVNRDSTEIVTFAVGGDQSLTRSGSTQLSGVVRSFGIDPAGAFLLAGGDDGNLQTFSIGGDGSLSLAGTTSDLGDVHATEVRYLE